MLPEWFVVWLWGGAAICVTAVVILFIAFIGTLVSKVVDWGAGL